MLLSLLHLLMQLIIKHVDVEHFSDLLPCIFLYFNKCLYFSSLDKLLYVIFFLCNSRSAFYSTRNFVLFYLIPSVRTYTQKKDFVKIFFLRIPLKFTMKRPKVFTKLDINCHQSISK